jgi:hypothetical protein
MQTKTKKKLLSLPLCQGRERGIQGLRDVVGYTRRFIWSEGPVFLKSSTLWHSSMATCYKRVVVEQLECRY